MDLKETRLDSELVYDGNFIKVLKDNVRLPDGQVHTREYIIHPGAVAVLGSAYSSSFIQHWLHEILFHDFALWVFTVAYTVFGILVIIAWLLVPPGHARN